jgi:hypothetical protein
MMAKSIYWIWRPGSSNLHSADGGAAVFQSFFENYLKKIGLVCVIDTILSADHGTRRMHSSASEIYRVCSALNIPVNVTDMPDLCDFSFTSTHRFKSTERTRQTNGPADRYHHKQERLSVSRASALGNCGELAQGRRRFCRENG